MLERKVWTSYRGLACSVALLWKKREGFIGTQPIGLWHEGLAAALWSCCSMCWYKWVSSPLEELPAHAAQDNRASVWGIHHLWTSAVPGCVNTAPVQLYILFIATIIHLFFFFWWELVERPIAERQVPLGGSADGRLALPSGLPECFAFSENWTTCSDTALQGNTWEPSSGICQEKQGWYSLHVAFTVFLK